MANTSGAGTSWNLPDYIGNIYMVGSDNKTPFLNMMGGLEGGTVRLVGAQQFAVSQPWDLATAADSTGAITETASLGAQTAYDYVRGVSYNSTQIVQRTIYLSYVKLSSVGQLTADTTTKLVDASEWTPAQNEFDFQVNANLKQIGKDLESTCFQGTYVQATSAGVAGQSRGLEELCASNNTVGAASADLSKDLVNELLRTMLANGAEFENPILFCNAFQKQQISNEYGYEPEHRNVGGVNIQQIMTDFCVLGVAYTPAITTSTVVIADMSVCHPVWLPVPGKGILFYEELGKLGAAEYGQIFGQFGLDHGPGQYHGSITSLSTS